MITQDDVQELRNLVQVLNQATPTVEERVSADVEERSYYRVRKTLWSMWIDGFTDLADRMEEHLFQPNIEQEKQNGR